MTPPAPQKLPGRLPTLRMSIGGSPETALYLGANALIQSQLFFYKEGYRQYEWSSIQACTLRRTARGKVLNGIGAFLAASFGALACATPELAVQWTLGIIAGVWLMLLAVNVLRGATCRVELQTAVCRRELTTLNRMRPARHALRLIAENVERVQGALPPADAAARMDDFLAARGIA